MLHEVVAGHRLILASGSPRRQRYFKELGLEFEIRVVPVEEIAPSHLKGPAITDFLAKLKADAQLARLQPKEILVTADTIVWYRDRMMPKPKDEAEAFAMLSALSGDWHEVITSVCVSSVSRQEVKHCITRVKFRNLTEAEINYYIQHYKPYDKAGGYGIQEWIGLIGISEIKGSYPNVVGLPTTMIYDLLTHMAG